jgi:hypothetical protein
MMQNLWMLPGIRKVPLDFLLFAPAKGTPNSFGHFLSWSGDMNSALVIDPTHVLTSWKDIARYMGKGVRTVQRWEQDFGLPVRRPCGSSKKAVLARPRDLDAWVALRCASRPEPVKSSPEGSALRMLTEINEKMETARMLRQDNLVLMREVNVALDRLREQVVALRARN